MSARHRKDNRRQYADRAATKKVHLREHPPTPPRGPSRLERFMVWLRS